MDNVKSETPVKYRPGSNTFTPEIGKTYYYKVIVNLGRENNYGHRFFVKEFIYDDSLQSKEIYDMYPLTDNLEDANKKADTANIELKPTLVRLQYLELVKNGFKIKDGFLYADDETRQKFIEGEFKRIEEK